ncbi:MAG: hypothetical protein L3J65_00985 [Robiginitomaculum sp.]|nr:hypothetical protein [Robiginitomaculum sp.]
MFTLATILMFTFFGFITYFVVGIFRKEKRGHHFKLGAIGTAISFFAMVAVIIQIPDDVLYPDEVKAKLEYTTSKPKTKSPANSIVGMGFTTEEFDKQFDVTVAGAASSMQSHIHFAQYELFGLGQEMAKTRFIECCTVTVRRKLETHEVTSMEFEINMYLEDEIFLWRDGYKLIGLIDGIMRAGDPNLSGSDRNKFINRLWVNEQRYFDIGRYAASGMELNDVQYFLRGDIEEESMYFWMRP